MKKIKKLLSLTLALAMLPFSAVGVSAEKESGIGNLAFTAWTLNRYTANTPWDETVDTVEVTPDGGYNGTSGLAVDYNSAKEGGRYMMLSSALSSQLQKGSTYRVSVRYKSDKGYFAVRFNSNAGWKHDSLVGADKTYTFETENGWTKAYKNITPDVALHTVMLAFDRPEATAVIDDLSVQLMVDTNSDGVLDTPSGTELVPDSGFSQYDFSYDFAPEYAAYASTSWKWENYGLNGTPGGQAQLTKKYAHSGDYSLYIKGEKADGYMGVEPTTRVSFVAGKSYLVEFYAMCLNKNVKFNADWTTLSAPSLMEEGAIDSKGWKKYSAVLKPTANSRFWMVVDHAEEMLLDDMSIYLLDDSGNPTGNNLVADGGFEAFKMNYTFDIEEDIYTSIGWKWENAGLNGTPGGSAQITKKYAHDGNYSLYIKGEKADGYMGVEPNTKVSFKGGKSYIVEFYAKCLNQNVKFNADWTTLSQPILMESGEPDSNGWIKYSTVLKPTANSRFWMIVDHAEEMLLDDISIYLLDENENKTGSNLVEDSGFEMTSEPAEDKYTFADWKVFKSQDALGENHYIEPSSKESKNGDYSMHVVYPSLLTSNYYMLATKAGSFPIGTYLVEYYIKGSGKGLRVSTGFGNNIDSSRADASGNYEDWTLVQSILPVTRDNNTFMFIAQSGDNMYIDDLKVYPVTAKDDATEISLTNYEISGESIIDDGFENVVDVLADEKVVNLVAAPVSEGNKLSISWSNPMSSKIEDIRLYLNNEEKGIDSPDMSYGAFNQIVVDGLTNYIEYDVKLVVTIDGQDYTFTTTGTPDDLGNEIYFGSWSSERVAGADVTAEKDNSGNTSIRIKSNVENADVNLTSEGITLRVDTEYVLKFKYKAENVADFSVSQDCNLNGTDVNSKTQIISDNTTTNNWVEKEITLAPEGVYDETDMDDTTYRSTITFLVGNGSLWIDDVELYAIINYELDDENLISGGDFEFGDYQISEPEFNLVAEDGAKTPVTEIKAGKIEVTTKIRNLAKGDSFTPAVIVALYNGTRLEKSVAIAEKNVKESSIILPAEEFTTSITVPALEGNDYSIKVMYWNGLDSLEPLADYDVLKAVK